MKKRMKLYIILALVTVFFVCPYFFKKNLCVKVSNDYINSWGPSWDTVYVNARPVNEYLEINELTIPDTLNYEVAIWNGKDKLNPTYENATIVFDKVFQIGLYAEVDIMQFAWEGTTEYTDKYIWVFFTWIRISHKLTGMA